MTYEYGKATGCVVDSSETGTIIEGLALTREGVTDSVSVLGKLWPVKICGVGDKFYGFAQTEPDINDELASLHKGIVKGWDATPGTVALDDPVKPAAAGKLAVWVGGTDYADTLVGFVEEILDATTGELLIRMRGD